MSSWRMVPVPQPSSGTHRSTINAYAGAALVFGSSAAVLVIELVALRLLAPYLGLTLETSTFVIGTALAAIAIGSWMGGQTADRVSPHHMLAPLLAISGVVVGFTPFLVRSVGAGAAGTEGGGVLLVAMVTLLVPVSSFSRFHSYSRSQSASLRTCVQLPPSAACLSTAANVPSRRRLLRGFAPTNCARAVSPLLYVELTSVVTSP